MSEMVSKNFSIKELSCKCCGVMGAKPAFIEKLQEMRDLLGGPIVITSAYRCEKHNQEIKGHKNSQHILGLAADIACTDSMLRYKILQVAYGLGFKGIGIGSTFIHVDYRVGMNAHIWMY